MSDVRIPTHRHAGCVIRDEAGRMLLMHRPDQDEWELPGGRADGDEPLEITAAREVFEELGIDVEIQHALGTTSFERSGKTYEFTWYAAVILEGTPTPRQQAECDRVAYLAKEELRTMSNLSTTLRELLAAL